MLSTTIDNVRIRASYNGGFTAVRRDLGILQRAREIFFASLEENLRPWAGKELNVFASTGSVGQEASEWWGSSQAALSVAIWATTSDLRQVVTRIGCSSDVLQWIEDRLPFFDQP
ncbi:MAG TPA: hypothetical protein VKM72_26650 [Thermoanaerobaculia bacterium]|nr:hypothetical protein [Thermoanaerobaculia bacterium]